MLQHKSAHKLLFTSFDTTTADISLICPCTDTQVSSQLREQRVSLILDTNLFVQIAGELQFFRFHIHDTLYSWLGKSRILVAAHNLLRWWRMSSRYLPNNMAQ